MQRKSYNQLYPENQKYNYKYYNAFNKHKNEKTKWLIL